MQQERESFDRSGGIEPHLAAPAETECFFVIFCCLFMMLAPEVAVLLAVPKEALLRAEPLLVEGLGVGGGGRDVGVTGSLVGASGELELVGGRSGPMDLLCPCAGAVIYVIHKKGRRGWRGNWDSSCGSKGSSH